MAVVIIIIVILALFVALTYNSLNKEKNRIELAEQEYLNYEETGTAEDIDNARKCLVAVIRDYNTKVESFPTSIVANLFNFPTMHTPDFE